MLLERRNREAGRRVRNKVREKRKGDQFMETTNHKCRRMDDIDSSIFMDPIDGNLLKDRSASSLLKQTMKH